MGLHKNGNSKRAYSFDLKQLTITDFVLTDCQKETGSLGFAFCSSFKTDFYLHKLIRISNNLRWKGLFGTILKWNINFVMLSIWHYFEIHFRNVIYSIIVFSLQVFTWYVFYSSCCFMIVLLCALLCNPWPLAQPG